ncbi:MULTISPECIES: uracil phosphoribosyltransferase [unclassified Microcoleus]|uniref:uracil phosphoribosyltransferase n=1 Tax=unclassified Microcoleus TaxID=2642155 RepID=UPI002FCFAE1E
MFCNFCYLSLLVCTAIALLRWWARLSVTVPLDIEPRDVLIVDRMLAAGNSAVAAVDRLKEVNPKSIKFLCSLAAPEGVEYLHQQHSDVQIYTAAVDERLDDRNYIVPGLVHAGDRLYGTI